MTGKDQIIKAIEKLELSPDQFIKLPRMAQIELILHTYNGEVELKELKESTLKKIYKIISNEQKRANKKNCQGGKQKAESRLLESEAI